MLKIISLEIIENDKLYFLNKYSGNVYLKAYTEHKKKTKKNFPPKVEFANSLVINPYLLSKVPIENISRCTPHDLISQYSLKLTSLTSKSFFKARLYASFRKKRFDNASQAINFFRSLNRSKPQDELCLSRTFFAAALSREFKNSGVLFIGIHLPSNNLHSWIIENGSQADSRDKIWINYQPIALIY